MKRPILGITMGDAAGVGPEIIVKALKKEDIYKIARPIVFGDAKIINRAIGIIGADIKCNIIDNPEKGKYQSGIIDIIDLDNLPVDLPFAKVDGRAGKAAYEYIESAVKYTMKNEIHAIVTAPLNKEALNLGGVHYPGHTEILGHLTGQKDFSMMLTSPKLRVIHVSTHIALHDVPKVVKKERISKVIDLAQETLKLMGFDEPRIAVAGLNPHCGEGGLFGDEDEKEIVPAIKEAQAKGYNVTGPVPPDSVFHRAANLDEFDIVVVMYHDQGHIPIKVLGFDSGVNVTVGLPCIRTSVDHGTAFPVAGTGKASHHEFTVTGSESGQTWFGIYANGAKQPGGAYGQQDLILDNLKITPVKSGEVDTTKLEAELNNADKVVLDAFEDGKEKAAFEAAYAAAQKVLENPTDQAAVDKAEKDLEDARKALLATSPKPEEDKEAPTKPSDLKVTDKTDTTVKIEWKASKDNVGVTGYKIFVNGKSIGTVKDDVLTAEIAKLTPKTEYTIEVVAYDAAGNKSAAASVKATTKEGKTPETPTTPEVKPGTVQTGDATPFAVPFMMMFIAVAMFAGVSVIRVKKRK